MKCFALLFIVFDIHIHVVNAVENSPDQELNASVSDIVSTLQTVSEYATKGGGPLTYCHCLEKNKNSFWHRVQDTFKKSYLAIQGKGGSWGVDGHILAGGGQISLESLRFGNALTMLDENKGIKFAVYCVGGVGGGPDLINLTVDGGSVQTFGSCDSPKDYAGGFLNLGAQGETGYIALGAKLSIS